MQRARPAKLLSPYQLGPVVLVVALLYAGIAKAVRIDLFMDSLATWELLPVPVQVLAAFLVPAVEVAIAVRWLTMGPARLDFVWAPLAMMLAFTAVYAAHYIMTGAPNCACFGEWATYRDDKVSGLAVLLRNLILIQCGAIAGLLASVRWVRVACAIVLGLAFSCGIVAASYAFSF